MGKTIGMCRMNGLEGMAEPSFSFKDIREDIGTVIFDVFYNCRGITEPSWNMTVKVDSDVRFHDIIYMATDNQKLIQLLNNLREQMYRYRVEYLKREEAHPQLIAEHAAIIEYISKGEKKAATDIMCKHIDNQVTTVIDVIRTKQN